ncbi:MAG: hypothetical protein GWM92_10780 [Gemmatimonadetes bacterium]|nr:hypothetical protein [Gemmatimonadota bacterium]NIR79181.1 hypothetical protein [Gemmatimonadota bacterium]NIT87836.1 hypothetical protein [Gemmatimonadota bacterium]NIU31697.1 hypothetical protein [Gemmatimonadota bacterium]NIU36316.1 hypothetical protein [Gemmatimonadota bacterium]
MRRAFAVGRISAGTAEIVWVEKAPSAPFPGPWTLKSVVRPAPPRERPKARREDRDATVH